MKQRILVIIGIVLIGIGIKIYLDLSDENEIQEVKHILNDPDFVLISDSISPNQKYRYYEYQFDNGGMGYSRVFWSVIKIDENTQDLKRGLIPDGFKAIGWTKESQLILSEWKPYYHKELTELKSQTELNGVKITLIK